MHKKKILFLLHLPPPVHGSSLVGKTIFESNMLKKAYNCSFINLLASKNIAETGRISLIKILSFLGIWCKLFKSLISFQPELCYFALTTTGAAFFRDVLLVALLKFFKIKRVYHLHNKGVSRKSRNFFYRFFYRFVFNKADVILLSHLLYNDVAAFVPKERIHICPNGVADNAFYNTSTPENSQTDTGPIQILFLSNLIASKGVFDLLQACRILKEKQLPFFCSFVGGEGDITSDSFFNKASELGVADQVYYAGKQYGEAKETFFSNADIFAFPTYYKNETFGLVIIEAMKHSLPVVSTFEGGIPDVLGDGITGFLVPQQNIIALSDKLEQLILNADLRKQMGLAGRKRYEENFTLEHFESRLAEIITDLTK